MNLRRQLVDIALKWQDRYGVAPHITSTLSEYDAAMIIGCTEEAYSDYMQDKTAVTRGVDFVHYGKKYQIKGSRPSGKPGSTVTLVTKAKNYEWDFLIWVHYTKEYEIQEAWLWTAESYKSEFHDITRLSPEHMRRGHKLEVTANKAL